MGKRFGGLCDGIKSAKNSFRKWTFQDKIVPKRQMKLHVDIGRETCSFSRIQPGPVLLRLLQYGNVLTLHTKRARKGRSRLLKMAHGENITLSVRLWICKKTFREIDITCCGWLVEPYNFLVQKIYFYVPHLLKYKHIFKNFIRWQNYTKKTF